MRVLEPGLIGEQRIVHLPEAPLQAGRLGRARGRPRARVATRTGKCRNTTRNATPLELPVENAQKGHSKSAYMISERRVRCAANVIVAVGGGTGAEARSSLSSVRAPGRTRAQASAPSPSKIRLAPGRSPGEAAW